MGCRDMVRQYAGAVLIAPGFPRMAGRTASPGIEPAGGEPRRQVRLGVRRRAHRDVRVVASLIAALAATKSDHCSDQTPERHESAGEEHIPERRRLRVRDYADQAGNDHGGPQKHSHDDVR